MTHPVRGVLMVFIAAASIGCRREPVRPVGQLSAAMQGLVTRAEAHAELRRKAAHGDAESEASTDPAELEAGGRGACEAVRNARPAARRGDVIDPAAEEELRLILRDAPRAELAKERAELRDEPTGPVTLQVNASYPESAPLVTMPPSLLRRLPPLPEELQFRVVGRALVLLDRQCRLIVDFVPDALPP